MRKLVLLALVDLAAQLVGGSPGMGYGTISSSLLLLAGPSPALVSVSAHLAEIGTTLVSGVSHWKLGNTDPRLVVRLGLPGAVGALSRAMVLFHLSTRTATSAMASLLIPLGIYVLGCFALRPPRGSGSRRSLHSRRLLIPLGMVGGFVDATGGSDWGPVVTMTLLTDGRTAPCTVVGLVGASEFLVTVAASAGFLTGLGVAGISLETALTLLASGLVATPISAWLISCLPEAMLGTAVGGLILATSLQVLLSWAETSARTRVALYGVLGVIWTAFLALMVRRARVVATEIWKETEQALKKVRSDPQHGHAPEAAVPDESLATGGPVGPRPVESAHLRKRSVLVVELV